MVSVINFGGPSDQPPQPRPAVSPRGCPIVCRGRATVAPAERRGAVAGGPVARARPDPPAGASSGATQRARAYPLCRLALQSRSLARPG